MRHTNENVNTDLHSAEIIINHRTVALVTTGTFTDISPALSIKPPPLPVLLAVQPLDLKVRIEVKDDALRRLRRCNDPVAVLVGRVLQGVTRGGDVARLAGIKDATALCCCDGDREGGRRRREVIEWKSDKIG